MLIILGLLAPALLTLPVFYALFASHKVNVDNLVNVEISFFKKVVKTLVMLIMLIMLIYMYIYIYMRCEIINWSKFRVFQSYELGKVKVINWSKVIFAL